MSLRSCLTILPLALTLAHPGLEIEEIRADPLRAQPAPALTLSDEERRAYLLFQREENLREQAALGVKFMERFPRSETGDTVFLLTLKALQETGEPQSILAWGERYPELRLRRSSRIFVLETLLETSQRLQQFEKAVAYGRQLLQVDPQNMNALFTIPFLHSEHNLAPNNVVLKEQAIASAKAGLKLSRPEKVPEGHWKKFRAALHASLGLIYFRSEQYAMAQAEYRKVIQVRRGDPVLYFRAGLAYSYGQRYAEAAALLSKSVFLKGTTEKPARRELERVCRLMNKPILSGSMLARFVDGMVQKAGTELGRSQVE